MQSALLQAYRSSQADFDTQHPMYKANTWELYKNIVLAVLRFVALTFSFLEIKPLLQRRFSGHPLLAVAAQTVVFLIIFTHLIIKPIVTTFKIRSFYKKTIEAGNDIESAISEKIKKNMKKAQLEIQAFCGEAKNKNVFILKRLNEVLIPGFAELCHLEIKRRESGAKMTLCTMLPKKARNEETLRKGCVNYLPINLESGGALPLEVPSIYIYGAANHVLINTDTFINKAADDTFLKSCIKQVLSNPGDDL